MTLDVIPDYAEYKSFGEGLDSNAYVTKDGRLDIAIDLKRKLPDISRDLGPDVEEFAVDKSKPLGVPPMNIVIMIVGSRGLSPYPPHPFLTVPHLILYRRRAAVFGSWTYTAQISAPCSYCYTRDVSQLCTGERSRVLLDWWRPSRADELHGQE